LIKILRILTITIINSYIKVFLILVLENYDLFYIKKYTIIINRKKIDLYIRIYIFEVRKIFYSTYTHTTRIRLIFVINFLISEILKSKFSWTFSDCV